MWQEGHPFLHGGKLGIRRKILVPRKPWEWVSGNLHSISEETWGYLRISENVTSRLMLLSMKIRTVTSAASQKVISSGLLENCNEKKLNLCANSNDFIESMRIHESTCENMLETSSSDSHPFLHFSTYFYHNQSSTVPGWRGGQDVFQWQMQGSLCSALFSIHNTLELASHKLIIFYTIHFPPYHVALLIWATNQISAPK